MAVNQTLDSYQFENLLLPYDRQASSLSEKPRLVRGQNCYINSSDNLASRPGTIAMINGGITGRRVDRAWIVETLDTAPYVYQVVSAYNSGTTQWELWYRRIQSPTPSSFALLTALRQSNNSTAPHEAVVARGLLFIKGFPTSASGERLGSIIFDGTAGTVSVRPWGALGPTTPAALASSVVTKITSAITASATSMTVASTAGLPAVPFAMQLDYEQVTCTALGGSTYTITRGVNGTSAAAHASGTLAVYRNWTASAHPVTVNFGWEYSYCYKSITGHYTNRAPVQTNPDSLPSSTGPFFNMTPAITVQGLADTTNFPQIAILRKTDGGGTWYVLDHITNTGAGSITYTDNKLASGSGNADPIPDAQLSRAPDGFGPSLTSNSPPPTVTSPLVVGTDPVALSTPMAYFMGRIWYMIGNILFFSSQEELNLGVPEEAFPSGTRGNFFRLQHQGVNLAATSTALYIFTTQQTYVVLGADRSSFVVRPLLENIGAPYGHPRSVTRFADHVAFLTHDYRVALINGDELRIISDPLYMDLVTEIVGGSEVEIRYVGDIDKQYLVVAAHRSATPANSRQFVYDLTRSLGEEMRTLNAAREDFWFTPWTYPSTCMLSGRISEGSSRRRLVFFSFSTNAASAYLDMAGTTPTDSTAAGTANFTFDAVTQLVTIPPGNHVNKLRMPYLTPAIYSIIVERTLTSGDTDPNVFYFLDDTWTTPLPTVYSDGPASRRSSVGYKTTEYQINEAGHRIALEFKKTGLAETTEIANLIIVFAPDSGR